MSDEDIVYYNLKCDPDLVKFKESSNPAYEAYDSILPDKRFTIDYVDNQKSFMKKYKRKRKGAMNNELK